MVPNVFQGFYMVNLLEDAKIPMDPYWAASGVQVFRAISSFFGIFLNRHCKRKSVYLFCCVLNILGTSILATYYYYLAQEEENG